MPRWIELLAVGVIGLVVAAAAVVHPLLGGLVGAATAVGVRLYDDDQRRRLERRIERVEPDPIDELRKYSAIDGDGRLP